MSMRLRRGQKPRGVALKLVFKYFFYRLRHCNANWWYWERRGTFVLSWEKILGCRLFIISLYWALVARWESYNLFGLVEAFDHVTWFLIFNMIFYIKFVCSLYFDLIFLLFIIILLFVTIGILHQFCNHRYRILIGSVFDSDQCWIWVGVMAEVKKW